MRTTPPKWADAFLKWYCNPDLLEDIQGDLYELYLYREKVHGKRYANIKFICEVVQLIRLSLIRNPLSGIKTVSKNISLPTLIKSNDCWNDMIFETRNKHYGAYDIRKSYDGNKLFGFAIVLFLWVLIILWWLIQSKS